MKWIAVGAKSLSEMAKVLATFLPLKAAFVLADHRVPAFLPSSWRELGPEALGAAMIIVAGTLAALSGLLKSVVPTLIRIPRPSEKTRSRLEIEGDYGRNIDWVTRQTNWVIVVSFFLIGLVVSALQTFLMLLGLVALAVWAKWAGAKQGPFSANFVMTRFEAATKNAATPLPVFAAIVAAFLGGPEFGLTAILVTVVVGRRGAQIAGDLAAVNFRSAKNSSRDKKIGALELQSFEQHLAISLNNPGVLSGVSSSRQIKTHSSVTPKTITISAINGSTRMIARFYPTQLLEKFRSELVLHKFVQAAWTPPEMVITHELGPRWLSIRLEWPDSEASNPRRVSSAEAEKWRVHFERWSFEEATVSAPNLKQVEKREARNLLQGLKNTLRFPGVHQITIEKLISEWEELEEILTSGPAVVAFTGRDFASRLMRVEGHGLLLANAGDWGVGRLGANWGYPSSAKIFASEAIATSKWLPSEIRDASIRCMIERINSSLKRRDFYRLTRASRDVSATLFG
jgi:hypothetical protein